MAVMIEVDKNERHCSNANRWILLHNPSALDKLGHLPLHKGGFPCQIIHSKKGLQSQSFFIASI